MAKHICALVVVFFFRLPPISFGLMRHSTATKAENKMPIRLEVCSMLHLWCRRHRVAKAENCNLTSKILQILDGGQAEFMHTASWPYQRRLKGCNYQLVSKIEMSHMWNKIMHTRTCTHAHGLPANLKRHLHQICEASHRYEKTFEAMILLIFGE